MGAMVATTPKLTASDRILLAFRNLKRMDNETRKEYRRDRYLTFNNIALF